MSKGQSPDSGTAAATVRYYTERVTQRPSHETQGRPLREVLWTGERANPRIFATYRCALMRQLKQTGRTEIDADIIAEAARVTVETHANEIDSRRGLFGVMPGSFDPIHYGHVATALASMENVQLDGLVFAMGGRVPDKPEATAFVHRRNMVQLHLAQGYDRWMACTRLRYDLAEISEHLPDSAFREYAGSAADCAFGQKSHRKRALADIAAFSLLFVMNPGANWYYITGSDKVNKYAVADERELVSATLARHGVKILFFERDTEPLDLRSCVHRPWLEELWKRGMFVRGNMPYGGTSATKIRQAIADASPAVHDDVHPSVLAYIFQHALDGLYSFGQRVKCGEIQRGSDVYWKRMAEFRRQGLVDAWTRSVQSPQEYL